MISDCKCDICSQSDFQIVESLIDMFGDDEED